MTAKRDYNEELLDTSNHLYAYNFDFDVMHPYMIKAFLPFFRAGNLLELGSFKGDFTRRLISYYKDITCGRFAFLAICSLFFLGWCFLKGVYLLDRWIIS